MTGGRFEVEQWYDRVCETEQFRYWEAYYRIEPWGAWRENLHAGIIAQAIHATNANGPADINATTFILDTAKRPAQDPTERAFMNLCIKMGGKVVLPNGNDRKPDGST